MSDATSESAEALSPEGRVVGAERVVAVLVELADHPLGVTLDELAGTLRSSKPTVHRALATLRRAGLADMTGRGVYVLGDEYLRLAFRNLDGRPETARMQPLLEELAEAFGETAHYAVLTGKDIVYRAKTDPPHAAVRLTSVVGGRNPAYCTAVGKALLSTQLADIASVEAWIGGPSLQPRTPTTLTSAEALFADLQLARERGFALDDQENEVGINCLAIPVHLDGSAQPAGAVSISAVTFRCPLERLVHAVPAIRSMIAQHLGEHALR
jgi:IclR family transcriptional regulator, acetate operon repressor